MRKNRCFTYFYIVGNFDPDVVTERMGLQPDKAVKIGEKGKRGIAYKYAVWEFGRCDEYDVYTENQLHKTIDPLLDKIDILNEIREEFDVDLGLYIVPTLYPDTILPDLSPSMKVIDFCHATRTQLSIDMYY